MGFRSAIIIISDSLSALILSHQIAKFRSLRDPEGNKLTHNFRPIQPLNNRIVLANSPHSDEPAYRPQFTDEEPPTSPTAPPTTTTTTTSSSSKTNIMDLTSDEEETTIVYEVENWSTTIKFVPAPVQPISVRTTKMEELTTSTTERETSTLGIIVFPDSITDLPGNDVYEVTDSDEPVHKAEVAPTHKTHRLDNMRGRGKGSGQAGAVVKPQSLLALITVTATTTALLVITTNLLL